MPSWIEVATIYEIPDGSVHVVEVENPDFAGDESARPMEIALFRVEGEIYAIEDNCTHADVALSNGHVEGTAVFCPLHGAKFCLKTGNALSPPASSPTRSFPVQLRDEFVDVYV